MKRRIRIVQVNSSFNDEAPAQGAAALARYLDPAEFDVSAVSLREHADADSTSVEDLARSSIPHRSLGMKGFFDLRVVSRLLRLMHDVRPDVVHTHALRADLWAGVAARLSGVPVFVTSIRNEEWECFRTEQSYLAAQGAMAMSRFATSLADVLIAVSEGVKEHLVNDQRIRVDKVRVIPNGVDLDRLNRPRPHPSLIRRDLGLPPDSVVVGTLAVLKPRKGLSFLVEAAQSVVARIPEVYFVIAGEGPERTRLERQIRSLGLEGRVRMLGHRSDGLAVLDAVDVYVLPSLFEGLPRSVLEAMAFGKPVVATDIGGNREAVQHDVSGLIVPPRDPVALAKAIERMASSPSLRKEMGEAGRQRVHERLNARVNARDHEAVYREVLASKGRP